MKNLKQNLQWTVNLKVRQIQRTQRMQNRKPDTTIQFELAKRIQVNTIFQVNSPRGVPLASVLPEICMG